MVIGYFTFPAPGLKKEEEDDRDSDEDDLGTKKAAATTTNGSQIVSVHQAVVIPEDSPYAHYMWKGNCVPGQLTERGAKQQQQMGHDLRAIYVDKYKLLPETFDPRTTRIRSTDVWRTKQSAENLMIGLYGESAFEQGLPMPTFMIHTLPSDIDYMTMNDNRCPRIRELTRRIAKDSPVLRNLKRTSNVLREQVSLLIQGVSLGRDEEPVTTSHEHGHVWSLDNLIDAVLPRICHGMPLQCGGRSGGGQGEGSIESPTTSAVVTEVDQGEDEEEQKEDQGHSRRGRHYHGRRPLPAARSPALCVTKEMADHCLHEAALEAAEENRDAKGVRELLQLGIGPLTKDIRKNLLDAKEASTSPSPSPSSSSSSSSSPSSETNSVPFMLYSGHDTTLTPLLGMLDATDMRWPPYASNLILELWKAPSSKGHFARVLYNGRVVDTVSKWCDLAWCPLDTMVHYLSQFVVDDLASKCKKRDSRSE
ncbi:Lysophosphatidic acid phosphatase type 6 [Mortierella sp. GBA43]|nr:Lysophosphatidic acid phosphatase type 6 [Mortierella sp. GBA43]